ncbi:MAG: DNA repair protein RecN [Oscillospiraceae bacterium]
MLSELYIKNLAVIKEITVNFSDEFNVFTGETGAGKSIIIDAINAILGQRVSKEIVRNGEEKSTITAYFTDVNQQALKKIAEFGLQIDSSEVVISREITKDAKSSARICGQPVTVAMLKEIGALLINIHGQHDNQILLSQPKHLGILDKYNVLPELITNYHDCYKNVVTIKKEINSLSKEEEDKKRKIDLLEFQIDEISQANLLPNEDEDLEKKQIALKNGAMIMQQLNKAHSLLAGSDDDSGAYDLASMATAALEKLDSTFEFPDDLFNRLFAASAEIQEIVVSLSNIISNFDFNPAILSQIEMRLDEIFTLKQKYGANVKEILAFQDDAQKQLDEIKLSEKRLDELNVLGNNEYNKLLKLAQNLTESRKEAAQKFIAQVSEELTFLDMPNVSVDVAFLKVKPNAKGQDDVEFLISTNKGEPPKSIAKIASGGELSRIMLAIKNTLADKDEIQTLIFDEIDTGVSGRAAQKIGLKLRQAANNRQVLAVTHSAQIAALAKSHFLIKKETIKDKTFTKVVLLDKNGRINEVARIMSTDNISDLMLENAKDMLKQAGN